MFQSVCTSAGWKYRRYQLFVFLLTTFVFLLTTFVFLLTTFVFLLSVVLFSIIIYGYFISPLLLASEGVSPHHQRSPITHHPSFQPSQLLSRPFIIYNNYSISQYKLCCVFLVSFGIKHMNSHQNIIPQ